MDRYYNNVTAVKVKKYNQITIDCIKYTKKSYNIYLDLVPKGGRMQM